jgi:capsular polysaccharide biosynthesis protein
VTASDGASAADTCNSVVESLANSIADLEPRSRSGDPSVELVTVETAEEPTEPDQPAYARNGILAGLAGLVIAFGLTWRRGKSPASVASQETDELAKT